MTARSPHAIPTAADWRLVAAIARHLRATGTGPTYAELARACGIASRGTIGWRVARLERLGLIEPRVPGRTRDLRPARAFRVARSPCGDRLVPMEDRACR
ncbi:LexA DNA binding domain-containing protein [Rhodovulum sp. ES.010]|uniref:LexA family protein n=1 Tax=Rhodovulum sp. ES.010 TaxID=1882821 RepID=UPI000926CCC0|nr:MarR family transcriptional regulator [Rhodovulum sp. ES.010]SIO36797.1 LexA DNA binding domain-containing protein [Rhodovulum sp. ES.010]